MKLVTMTLLLSVSLIQCQDNNVKFERQFETKSELKKPVNSTELFNCSRSLIKSVLENDTIEIVKLLIKGCDVNQVVTSGYNYYSGDSTYHTPLSSSNSYTMTKLLLESGADPNIELGEHSPLESAIILHKNQIVKLLLKYKADVNHFNKFTEYQNALIAAISTGNRIGLNILLENGAKFKPYNKNIHDPIHKSINHQQYDIAKYLLQQGLNSRIKVTPVNLEGEFGDCVPCPYAIEPIHSAVQLTDISQVKKFIDLLIDYNADLNAKTKDGLSSLGYIVANGNAEIAKYLISKGAVVDDGAINQAVSYQNNDYLHVLLKNWLEPNSASLYNAIVCCGDGFNNAAIDSRMETVELLLNYGVKPEKRTINLIRNDSRHHNLIKIFEKYGY